jgi:hypothetical protein
VRQISSGEQIKDIGRLSISRDWWKSVNVYFDYLLVYIKYITSRATLSTKMEELDLKTVVPPMEFESMLTA